jgi:lipopolysaccharide transport system permease protein
MITAAMMVKFRDVGYILPWLLQILLYASPVAYALSSVPDRLRWVFDINPITWFLEAFRWSLVGTTPPAAWQVVGLVIVSVAIFFAGILYFQSHEREFADII